MTSKACNKKIYHSAVQRNNTPSNTQWYNVSEIKFVSFYSRLKVLWANSHKFYYLSTCVAIMPPSFTA